MQNIETLYSSYQELLLDLDIFGKIMSTPPISRDDLKQLLFEEFQRTHPIPKLEDVRYTLSDLVSSDFHIYYNSEIELLENEEFVQIGNSNVTGYDLAVEEDFSFPEDFPLDDFNTFMTDLERSNKMNSLDYFNMSNDIEEFTGDIQKVEEVYATNTEVFEEVYEDEEEEIESFDFDEDDISISPEEDTEKDEEVSNLEIGTEEEDDFTDFDLSTEDEEEEEDFTDFDLDTEDEEIPTEESNTEEDEDFPDLAVNIEEEEDSSNLEVNTEEEDIGFEDIDFIDSAFVEDNSSVEVLQKPINKVVETPPIPQSVVNKVKEDTVQKEVINRDNVPKDLVEFLRKYPRSEVSEVLKYFSRKEVEKYIMIGRVIKKGNKLHI